MKRRATGHKLVGQYADCKNVGFLGNLGNFLGIWSLEGLVAWLLDHFWGHVLGSSSEPIQSTRGEVDVGGEPEVTYLAVDLASIGLILEQKDIVRLDVAVDDVLIVQKLEGK